MGKTLPEKSELTPKEERFCQEYMIDLNASRAYREAGYSANKSKNNAFQLMQKQAVKARISELRHEMRCRTQVKAEHVIQNLMCVGDFDPAEAFDENGNVKPLNEIPPDVRMGIAGLKITEKGTEIRFWSHTDALDKVAKVLGLYAPDKLELTAPSPTEFRGMTREQIVDHLERL